MLPETGDTRLKLMIDSPTDPARQHYQPTITAQPIWRLNHKYPPYFIACMSLFEIIAFIYYALRSDEPFSTLGPVPFKSKLIYDPYRRYEVWRFLSYSLIHAGYLHLIFNLLVQIAIGAPLEATHKFNPIFIIYFGGVFGGALGNSILDPHSYLAGASGGCYALVAAHLSDLVINMKEHKAAILKIIVIVSVVSMDLGVSIFERHYGHRNLAYRTSYGGHAAGFFSGLFLGINLLKNFSVTKWEIRLARICMGLYVFLVTTAIAINIFYSDYFPLPDKSQLVWSENPFLRVREIG